MEDQPRGGPMSLKDAQQFVGDALGAITEALSIVSDHRPSTTLSDAIYKRGRLHELLTDAETLLYDLREGMTP